MDKELFRYDMQVRDYECDIQGVVNNANYQHYMEHSRHEFLISLGCSFSVLHNDGIDLMVSKATIEYKTSLRGGDRFYVSISMKRSGAKLICYQNIYRKPDDVLCAKGVIDIICLQNGRLTRGEKFDELFRNVLA
ncbi:MAG: acyl-CoA thioesterase [Bacteroidaceae bacterium]|nr:acyl-CoA thioesterase [Bacteroidaceae bacterium]